MLSSAGTAKKFAGRAPKSHKLPVFRALSRVAGSPPVPASIEGHPPVFRPYLSSKPLSRRLTLAGGCPSLSRLLAEC
jgi:hypothetical protein